MKLVQKILSHGLLIAFIVAVIFIYIRRDELLTQWAGKTDETVQQTQKEKPDVNNLPVQPQPSTSSKAPVELETEIKAEDISGQVQQESGDNVTIETTEKAPVTDDQTVTETPKTLSGPEPAPEQKQTLTEVLTPKPPEPVVIVQPEPKHDVLPGDETQQEKTTPVAVKDVVVQPQSDTEPAKVLPLPPVNEPDIKFQKQLSEARWYFWQHDLPAAAAAYQMLAEAYPENPDVWGEIGNFYFTLRQRKPVIRSYSRSVELLIEQGELAHARQLIGILYRLGAPRARDFEIQIQQAGG